ncbi:MAG: 4-oxalocrotonate tautomerase family protein [Flavobacteriaceae bacterium]
MPILEIEYIATKGELIPGDLAQRIADAAESIFNSPKGTIWIKLRQLEADGYAENGIPSTSTPRPVFAKVLKRKAGDESTLRGEAMALARCIAQQMDRDVENIHIIYEASAQGRIAFGGELLC